MTHSHILIHRLRAIIGKLINHADGRIELIEKNEKQFIRLDGQITGQSLQHYAGMDELFEGFALGDFAELTLSLENHLATKNLCKEEMIKLAEFVPEDKRTKWLSIW